MMISKWKNFLSFFSFLIFFNFSAQQNLEWLKIKKYKVAELEDKIDETSALNFLGNRLFTLNDSGNPEALYELNPENGKILQTYPIPNSKNLDWEALTNDGTHFYIGDIGNNSGTRKDLKIYKLSADSLKNLGAIKFFYPEQKEFVRKPQNNDYDAESLVFINGNLHLFTKEWNSYKTTNYIISTETSNEARPAQKIEDFNLCYVATDAAYFEKKLYIIGYTKKMEVYLTVFEEDENGNFFNKKPRKFYLGMSSTLGQIEGIAVNRKGIYISGERFKIKPFNVPPKMYFIPKEKFPW